MKKQCFLLVFLVCLHSIESLKADGEEVTTMTPDIVDDSDDTIVDLESDTDDSGTEASLEALTKVVSSWRIEEIAPARNHSDGSANMIPSKYEEEEELDLWEAPTEIRKNYPFYLTGFDDENRPIWVAEWGHFDMQKIARGSKETKDTFDKYVRKTVRTIVKSRELRATPWQPVNQVSYILDFDQLKLEQLADIRTVTYVLKMARENRDVIENHTAKVFIVNANYVAELVINLARTVFTRLFENFEVHGTNKAKWLPHIIRAFPQDQLPPWYGGSKDHKPVIVCG